MAESPPMTLQDFEPHVGAALELELEDGRRVEAVLLEASAFDTPRPKGVAPGFSLVFRVSSEPALTQGLYALEHPDQGPIGLFLVPIGAEEGGVVMEAVFN